MQRTSPTVKMSMMTLVKTYMKKSVLPRRLPVTSSRNHRYRTLIMRFLPLRSLRRQLLLLVGVVGCLIFSNSTSVPPYTHAHTTVKQSEIPTTLIPPPGIRGHADYVAVLICPTSFPWPGKERTLGTRL